MAGTARDDGQLVEHPLGVRHPPHCPEFTSAHSVADAAERAHGTESARAGHMRFQPKGDIATHLKESIDDVYLPRTDGSLVTSGRIPARPSGDQDLEMRQRL